MPWWSSTRLARSCCSTCRPRSSSATTATSWSGQQVTNIIPEGFAERLIADDLRSAEDALAQQIGTGIELTGRRKDGSDFPIEIMLSPLEDADGVLVTAAIRNISVRKAAEAHLLRTVEELNRSNGAARAMAHADGPLGRARLPDRPAEPHAAERPDQPGDRHGAAPRQAGRGAVPGPRWLQAHQRFTRPPDRRQASAIRGASAWSNACASRTP